MRMQIITKLAIIVIYGALLTQQAFVWKEEGLGRDCSVTCGPDFAVGGRSTGAFTPYACAVNGSEFGSFKTGTQAGSLWYVSNKLSCYVYSDNPGGPSSTAHSSWYCLCGDSGGEFWNFTGAATERCSTTCAQEPDATWSISVCQLPNFQSVCYNRQESSFGYQDTSPDATDQSCLAVSPPATDSPQSPPVTRSQDFDCLCMSPSSRSRAVSSNCTTSSSPSTSSTRVTPVPRPQTTPVSQPDRAAFSQPETAGHSSVGAGVIAGSVIGGVAGLVLLLISALLLWRHTKKKSLGMHAKHQHMEEGFPKSECNSAFNTGFKNWDSTTQGWKSSGSQKNWSPDVSSSNMPLNVTEQGDKAELQAELYAVPYSDVRIGPDAVGIDAIDVPSSNSSSFEDLPSSWHIPLEQVRLICKDGEPVKLGAGGFGVVLRGMVWNEDAALKTVKGGSTAEHARLLHEIKILECCRSRHIVQFFGYSQSSEGLLLCMEYLPGGNLYSALGNNDEFQWNNRGKQAMRDIAAGLYCLHGQGVAHLDMKSPNVLITSYRRVKIADFGLGKLINGAETAATQLGTLAWTAPEVLLLGVTGLPTDIYAFGTIMYEVCTLKRATRFLTLEEIKVPEHASAEVVDLIAACRELQPSDRPTIQEVCDLLASF